MTRRYKIGLIKGVKGVKHLGGGVNHTIIRLYKQLGKVHNVTLIYGNGVLPVTLGYLPIGNISGFDIVHAGAPEFAAFIRSSAPIITTFYDDGMCNASLSTFLQGVAKYSDRFKIRLNKLLLRSFIKRGLHKCQKIVAISQASKEMVMKSFDITEDKIEIIPPGIDTDTFKPLNIKKKDAGTLKLFFCGGISQRKGIDNLLKAVQLLEKKILVELWLAGAIHPSFNLHKELTKLKLVSRVKYYGQVSNNMLNILYNSADIFVMPSRFEGYGMPPLEALACGIKVVSTSIPSIQPFRKYVTIVKSDYESLAKGIVVSAKRDINLRILRQIILKKYSVKRMGQLYLKLYNSMLV